MYDSKGQHIEPNQVNDPSLDFFFFCFFGNICVTLTSFFNGGKHLSQPAA